MSKLSYLLVILLLLISIAMMVSPSSAQSLPCSYESSGQFAMLTDTDPELDVTVEQLEAVDAYLRVIYGDDQRDHVLGFYADTNEIASTTGLDRDWSGYTGVGIRGVRWNWQTCGYDRSSRQRVNLSLVSTSDDMTRTMGLILHELSYSSSGEWDGDSFWESIGGHAYNASCNSLSGIAVEHCNAIRILLDA